MSILDSIKRKIFIMEVPAYGNKLFYSLGFLALTSLSILIITGLVMVFEGSVWWLDSVWGVYFRSVHLWAAQFFIAIIILHALVVFLTSAFKHPRRLTWVLGSIVFFLALLEAEFGFDLRGDFSSQYRSLQGADLYNGAHLGQFVNLLNNTQVFGIHIVILPIVILGLLFFHYLLVKTLGIAKPYRPDLSVKMVPADHSKLFMRGGALAATVIILALVFPSPLVFPATIEEVANENPGLFGQTLVEEFAQSSDTATYLDSIDPYTYDTRTVYVSIPYGEYLSLSGQPNELVSFLNEPSKRQAEDIAGAKAYFENNDQNQTNNPVVAIIKPLIAMAQSGLYQSALNNENPSINPTYGLRFLADTGVMDSEAEALHITTSQWGMMHEETKSMPVGAWWLAPIGALDHTVLANDPNGDRDGAEVLGLAAIIFILFPYLPYLNRIPEKIGLAEKIWKTK